MEIKVLIKSRYGTYPRRSLKMGARETGGTWPLIQDQINRETLIFHVLYTRRRNLYSQHVSRLGNLLRASMIPKKNFPTHQ